MPLAHPDKTIDPAETADPLATDAEALFKEARQRGRRRRAIIAAAVGAGLAAGAALLLLLLAGGGARGAGRGGPRSLAPGRVAGAAALEQPTAMAVSPSGTLYVLDAGRDQILRLTRAGRFVVFAGTGVQGFSGDGGPAPKARLRLTDWSDIVAGRNGTVYVADSGNGRVRAVLANGTIETIAGDGRDGPALERWRGTRPARRLDIGEPHGLAVGTGGALYIGAEDLIEVTPAAGGADAARWLAGRARLVHTKRGAIPTIESEFSNAYGTLAVDRAGDVYLVNFPNLYERSARGKLLSLGAYRAGGGAAALVNGPTGAVYGAGITGIFRVDGDDPAAARERDSIASNRKLDAALGWRRLARRAVIAPAGGIAVAPAGSIYYDSDSGNGWVPSGVLAVITPDGTVRILWQAKP